MNPTWVRAFLSLMQNSFSNFRFSIMSHADAINPNHGPRPTNLIGPQVRYLRERLGLTQDELAGRLCRYGLELDYVKIGQIENGKRRVVDWELVGFARALGVSVTWLLCGEDGRL